MWLVLKTRAVFSINQIHTKTNRNLVNRVFPRFARDIFLAMIGCYIYFFKPITENTLMRIIP